MGTVLQFAELKARKENNYSAPVMVDLSFIDLEGMDLQKFIDLQRCLLNLRGGSPSNNTLATYAAIVHTYQDGQLVAIINGFEEKQVKARPHFYFAVLFEVRRRGTVETTISSPIAPAIAAPPEPDGGSDCYKKGEIVRLEAEASRMEESVSALEEENEFLKEKIQTLSGAIARSMQEILDLTANDALFRKRMEAFSTELIARRPADSAQEFDPRMLTSIAIQHVPRVA